MEGWDQEGKGTDAKGTGTLRSRFGHAAALCDHCCSSIFGDSLFAARSTAFAPKRSASTTVVLACGCTYHEECFDRLVPNPGTDPCCPRCRPAENKRLVRARTLSLVGA